MGHDPKPKGTSGFDSMNVASPVEVVAIGIAAAGSPKYGLAAHRQTRAAR